MFHCFDIVSVPRYKSPSSSSNLGDIPTLCARLCALSTRSSLLHLCLSNTMLIGELSIQYYLEESGSSSLNPPRDAVEARGKFASSGRSKGNENRFWHGTRRTCNLGDKDKTRLCSSSQCSLCSIIRNSFDVSVCKARTGWSRLISFFYCRKRQTLLTWIRM